MFGAITYIPLFVQGVVGTSASLAGYVLTPLMLALIFASIIGGRIISKVTYRSIIMVSMSIMGLGFILMSTMNVHTTNLTVVLYMIITGLGMGSLMPTFTIAVQSALPQNVRGVATSSSQFFRSIGGTMGVSIMGAIMANHMASGLKTVSNTLTSVPPETLQKFSNPQLLLNAATRSTMPSEVFAAVQKTLANAIDWVFITGVIFVFIGALAALFLGKARLSKSGEEASETADNSGKKLKVDMELL